MTSTVVANNVWDIHAEAGAFNLGLLVGTVGLALAGRQRVGRRGRPGDTDRLTGGPSFPRGGAAIALEDTLPSFAEGLRHGFVECDVHSTIDGEPGSHARRRGRREDRWHWAVNRVNYAEVARLDAGSQFSPDGGRSVPWCGKEVLVPTLI